jgi:hypothetical protein
MIHSLLADWLLACAVAPDERRALLGDLVEEYAIRRRDTSRVAASCWYGTQLLRSIPWLLWIPVRRSGLIATIGVTLMACAAQAAVELLTARVLPPGCTRCGHRFAGGRELRCESSSSRSRNATRADCDCFDAGASTSQRNDRRGPHERIGGNVRVVGCFYWICASRECSSLAQG